MQMLPSPAGKVRRRRLPCLRLETEDQRGLERPANQGAVAARVPLHATSQRYAATPDGNDAEQARQQGGPTAGLRNGDHRRRNELRARGEIDFRCFWTFKPNGLNCLALAAYDVRPHEPSAQIADDVVLIEHPPFQVWPTHVFAAEGEIAGVGQRKRRATRLRCVDYSEETFGRLCRTGSAPVGRSRGQ